MVCNAVFDVLSSVALVSLRERERERERERDGCFAFIVFLRSRGSQCSVSHPRGAVGWSVSCLIKLSLGLKSQSSQQY